MNSNGYKALVKMYFPLALLVVLGSISCNRIYMPASVQYEKIQITRQTARDPQISALLQPYADSVNKSMNHVIGEMAESHEKKLPESNLGNLMADAMYAEAVRVYGTKVDAAFMNYGGIRLTQLPAGQVTIGKVYELMPFDNVLVIQRLNGKVLQQFLDHVAGRGGWPCKGITYIIKDKKAVDVRINGVALDTAATYAVVNSDFVANGGDDCTMLRNVPQENKGYLVRDALIHYFSAFTERGEKINARTEKRVTYAE